MHTFVFFFNDTATTEIYTLSLHDALPILAVCCSTRFSLPAIRRSSSLRYALRDDSAKPSSARAVGAARISVARSRSRSEEHTSELQSRQYLVCRLLLEKKKKYRTHTLHEI